MLDYFIFGASCQSCLQMAHRRDSLTSLVPAIADKEEEIGEAEEIKIRELYTALPGAPEFAARRE
jgi:hypothetical protein